MWIFRLEAGGHKSEARRTTPSGSRYALIPGAWQPIPALTACCLLLTAYCSLPATHGLWAAGGLYQVREVKPNVFVWIPDDIIDQEGDPRFARAGNAGFIITTEGIVVVNTTNSPFHARELLYEIRHRTDQPVKYVINTSSGADEMLGNEVFADLQAVIISTPRVLDEIRSYRRELTRDLQDDLKLKARMRGIHPTVPSQTFDHETGMQVVSPKVTLVALAGTASSGDLAVHLPDAKVLFLGDLYNNDYFPQVGSRDVRGWIEALRQVEMWDVEVYVPGHGVPSGKRELVGFRRFLEWLLAEVKTRVQEGMTLEQVKGALLPFSNYHWHGPEMGPGAVEAVYRQLASRPQKDAPRSSQ
jgi:glyoxylase-like metal-dependent hydrolase (beta-lactamase superfamily II)